MNTNTRKYKVLIIALFLILTSCRINFAYGADAVIEWNPVCRHNALYWASTLQDSYEVRIMYGAVVGGGSKWHVQPQVLIGENWYYFEIKEDKVYIILNMETLYEGWISLHIMTLKDYVLWMFQDTIGECNE